MTKSIEAGHEEGVLAKLFDTWAMEMDATLSLFTSGQSDAGLASLNRHVCALYLLADRLRTNAQEPVIH